MTERLALASPWIVLLTVAAAYSGVWVAGYVWDDVALIVDNSTVHAPTWDAVWSRDLWFGTGQAPSPYYRPVMTASLLVDRHLLGNLSATAHLHSLAWHLAAVALVMRLFTPRIGALRAAFAGLVFGLHPVQSEAVTWIAARNDLLATALLLASIVLLDERPRPVAAAFAAFFALLSKESAVLAPAIYVMWRWSWRLPVRRADLFALGFGMGAALLLRLGADLGDFQNIFRVKPEHAFGPVWAVVRWLGWLSWPWPLTATATVYGAPTGVAYASAAATLVGFGLALRHAPRAALGLIGLFVATLSPALPTVFGTSMLGERYLYLPMVGVAGLVAIAPDLLITRAIAVAGVAASLLTLHVRLPDWVDNLSLFGAAAKRAPDGFSLWLHGNALRRAGRMEEALYRFEGAVQAEPFLPFGCSRAAQVGALVLPPALFLERVAHWEARGCRAASGFDDAVIWRLAVDERIDELLPRLETQTVRDDTLRSVCVRGGMRLRDGDWAYLMEAAQRHNEGPAAYLDCAYGVARSWP